MTTTTTTSAITPMPATTITTDFSKEDWEKWMNLDGQQQHQPDDSSPGTYLSGSPPPLQFVSGSLGSTSPSELESLPPLAFSPTYALPTTASKKRKSSTFTGGTTPSGRQPRGQKISHNVIEKRYRSNLNDKIAKLRDSVPELRSAQPTIKRRPQQKPVDSNSDASGNEDEQGLKFNKATVLVKATEYIQQLERQNQRLQQEVSTLKNRFASGKSLAPAAMTTGFATATYVLPQSSIQPILEGKPVNTESAAVKTEPAGLIKVPAEIQKLRDEVPPQPHYAPEASASSSTVPITAVTIPPFSEIQGMIPLPDSWKAFRAQTRTDEHYAPPPAMSQASVIHEADTDDDGEEGSRWSRSRTLSRLLVGSLAGLMVMEGLNENADEGSKIEKRGLFSLPTELLTESRGFRDPIRRRIIAFANSSRARQLLPAVLFSFLFMVLCFAILIYIAPSDSRTNQSAKGRAIRGHTIASNSTRNSIGLTVQTQIPGLTRSEILAVRLLDWLNLSWLIFNSRDEEADAEMKGLQQNTRWTRILLPRTLNDQRSSL